MPLRIPESYQRKYSKPLTDEEKQELLNRTGEMVGGTIGGMAGSGLASIPAAGAGTVAGKNAAELFGRYVLGLDTPVLSPEQELAEQGKTFLGGSVGEGVGKLLPPAFQAGKSLAGKIVKSAFKPTPEAQILKGIAQKYGVPLNVAQASGRPWLQHVGIALDRSPFSVDTIRKFRQGQYRAWEDSISQWLDKFRKGEVSQEEFARVAEQSIGKLREQLNQRVGYGAKKMADSMAPAPVSDVEAGQAIKAGREANIEAIRKWAEGEYGAIRKQAGGAPIDMGPLSEKAQELMGQVPSGQLEQFFPPKVLKYLRAANTQRPNMDFALQRDALAKSQTGMEFEQLPREAQSQISDLMQRIGLSQPQAVSQSIPLSEAMELRSQLLDAARRMSYRTNAAEIRATHDLIDGVNASMEGSLAGSPEIASRLKNANAKYRDYMQKVRPPMVKGKGGNPAARAIEQNEQPEKLPDQLTGSPTMVKGMRQAASPETTKAIRSEVITDPIPAVQRNVADKVVSGAKVRNPATGESRVSPQKIAEATVGDATQDQTEALFGKKAKSVRGIGKPALVQREKQLYGSPLAKAVDSGDTKKVFGEAFPRREPATVKQTVATLGETGNAPEAQRAFAENLIESSRTQDKAVGDIRYINPRTLERNVAAYGESVPAAIGRSGEKRLGDLTTLGKGLSQEEAVFGNPSGTARGSAAIQAMTNIYKPWAWPGMVAQAATYNQAAKRFTDPKLANWLTSPSSAPKPQLGGPISGMVGRAATMSSTPGPPPPPTGKPADDDSDLLYDPDSDDDLIYRP